MLRTPDDMDTLADRTADPRKHGGPVRLLAQRGLFFGPSPLVPEDLYSPVEHGAARRERHRSQLAPATTVTTNTYFGRFHATYWQRWTAVTEVEVEATRDRHRPGAADGLGHQQGRARIVDAHDVADADRRRRSG